MFSLTFNPYAAAHVKASSGRGSVDYSHTLYEFSAIFPHGDPPPPPGGAPDREHPIVGLLAGHDGWMGNGDVLGLTFLVMQMGMDYQYLPCVHW